MPSGEARDLAWVKSVLLEPGKQIELEEAVMDLAAELRMGLLDTECFPTSTTLSGFDLWRWLVDQVQAYDTWVSPLVDVLVVGGTWGRPEHEDLWSAAVQAVAATVNQERSGSTALLHLRQYPVLPVVYGASLAAMSRKNFGTLRSVSVDPVYRQDGREGPLVGWLHPLLPFQHVEKLPSMLVHVDRGGELSDDVLSSPAAISNYYVPVSEHLYEILRPRFRRMILSEGLLQVRLTPVVTDHAA